MSTQTQELTQTLGRLAEVGTLVKRRPYREVWRFEVAGRGYYLKWYPRSGGWGAIKRRVVGNPALREFERLVRLQKAGIAAPRAVAQLSGFRLGDRKGDAVILLALEPGETLESVVRAAQLAGRDVPGHAGLAREVVEVVRGLAKANLGHGDLHLGNFLRHEGRLHLLDGYAVRPGGLRLRDLQQLALSASSVGTTADVVRAWRELGPGGRPPAAGKNPVARRHWRKLLERAEKGEDYFGRLRIGEWRGVYFAGHKAARRWAPASALTISAGEWEAAWPVIEGVLAGGGEVLKASKSGTVSATTVMLGGRELRVVIKRPARRYWYRYLNEVGRGSRARRAWRRSWWLAARNIATAWPLAVMERRRWGYVVDQVVVCAHVAGPTLEAVDLDAMAAGEREDLMRRCGRTLRRIEELGLCHFDAKASNWIVWADPVLGPTPVLVDVDGVRAYRWDGEGIRRLLRSMRGHDQYTPADSEALCRGYAPWARTVQA